MRQLNLFRWVAALTVAIALAPAAASGQEDGTITISSTFSMDSSYGPIGPDLAEVYANGHEHTWTLTLHGTTHSHSTSDYLGANGRNTQIHATSFDFEFFGPDAATLNGIVSEYIAEWDVMIELSNYYSSGGNAAFMWVQLKVNDSWDLVFYVGHDFFDGSDGSDTLFPSDADGYPVVSPDPFSIWSDYSYIQDWRPWNEGWIHSRPSLVTFSSPLPGDFNSDNVVDAADYTVWRDTPNNFGGADGYNTWRTNFGRTSGSGLAASENPVPEPGNLALLTLAVPALLCCRRMPAVGPVRPLE